MAVLSDLVERHRVSQAEAGTEITRTFRVDDLQGAPEDQLLEALADPDIPQFGETYPNATAYQVRERHAEPAGPNAAHVQVVYSNRRGSTWNVSPPADVAPDVKQFSASVRTTSTTEDRDAAPMLIPPPNSFSEWDPWRVEAEIQQPIGELIFERVEANPPTQKWRDHGGTVNSAVVGAWAVNSLLFTRLDAISDDGGRTWRCTYVFSYDPIGLWRHKDRYRNPQSGQVPTDAAEVSFDVQPQSDFGLLGLDFTDLQSPL